MRIFKIVNISGNYRNTTDKYQILIHFYATGNIELLDENGNTIESFNEAFPIPSKLEYPSIIGQENTSTGAISYDSFNANFTISSYPNYKQSLQKILIPPNFSVLGINAGLIIELDNLEELKGLI